MQIERKMNMNKRREIMEHLHSLVQKTVSDRRRDSRASASSAQLTNFTDGDYVMVPRENLSAEEKPSLRWRSPWRPTFGL